MAPSFYRQGKHWFCRTALPSDIVFEVEAVLFHLHKFPLMSKSGKIAKIIEESQNVREDIYPIVGCPGGSDAFYLAALFCYGITVELTPKNILMAYSAAQYLEMTEEYGEDNLLATTESFIRKVILPSWKDCILALQSAEHSISRAQTLPIVSKCVSAVSMMVCTDLSLFGWPMMMYGSLQSPGGSILWNGINTGARIRSSVSDWWFEDISCLSVPMFKKLMETMNRRGVRPVNIAGAIMYYTRKYLPGLDRWHNGQGSSRSKSLASFSVEPVVVNQNDLLESIAMLLPERKGKLYCRFLLGLLRVSMILNVSQPCKDSLERKIGMQLELATVDGLLIPNFSDSDNLYDTDCVERIIRYFVSSQASHIAAFSPSSDVALSPSTSPLSRVAKLIDSYLSEISPDVNLKPAKMHTLLKALPGSLRLQDDGLYRALDIYLKAHPWVSLSEREQLCSIINCGKLSMDACEHASQNERLPLRFVLQVLFFEQLQLRAAISDRLEVLEREGEGDGVNDRSVGQRDGWVSLVRQNRHLKVDMERMRCRVRELEQEFASIKLGMPRTGGTSHGLITFARNKSKKLGRITDSPTAIGTIESARASPQNPI